MAALDQLLAQALSPLSSAQATAALQALKLSDPAGFLLDLGQILGSEDAIVAVRQLAGLLIKNMCRNEGKEEALSAIFARISGNCWAKLQFACLSALGCAYRDISEAAAQAVASLAASGNWPDIVPTLISACSHSEARHRQSAFLTLGYFLEQLPAGTLSKADSDSVLTALYRQICEEAEMGIEAVKALGCALQFASPYFQREQERQVLMKMLLAACRHADGGIRTAGLENMCEAAMWYYDYLGGYVGEMLQITRVIVNSGREKEAILALEMWNIVSEIEASRQESDQPTSHLSSSLSPTLCPLLLACLSQPVSQDRDSWTLQKASGALLVTLAEVVGDAIVDLSLPFIITNIRSTEANKREAAVLALGSVLEGPEDQKLQPLVTQAFPCILNLATEEDEYVRAASLWALSRICEHQVEAIGGEMQKLWGVLRGSLHSDQALLACSCFVHLIQQADQANTAIRELFQPLLDTALNSSGDLQLAAFSALQSLLQATSPLPGWLPQLIQLFCASLQLQGSEMRETLLCASIQITLSKANPESLTDSVVSAVLESVVAFFRKRRRLIEEGVNVIGALTSGIGTRILPYLGGYWDFLVAGLGTESGVCKAAIICVGDHARSLDSSLIPYLSTLIPPLFTVLESTSLPVDFKVQCIATLGDLATCTQAAFLPYLPPLMTYMASAAAASLQVVLPESDLDLFECLQELREAVVDFFASVVQGLTEAGQTNALVADLGSIVAFAGKVICEDYSPTESMHVAVLGLLGDLALAYGPQVRALLTSPDILQYVCTQESSTDPKLRSVAKWTLRELGELRN